MKFRPILVTLLFIFATAFSIAAQERRIDHVQTTSIGIGSIPISTVTAVEKGQGMIHQTVLTLNSVEITVRDTELGNGVKIYDFPEGRIIILGSTGSAAFTTTSILASTLNSGVSCRWGLGTVTQSSATLATTEQDLLPVTTFAAGTTINVANTATTSQLVASAQFDGTATAKDAFLNISVPVLTDIDANATVTVSGTITITWINLGDL